MKAPEVPLEERPTPRWTTLRVHTVQAAYWNSPHRFNVVPAGRRSGKTELAKRKLIARALMGTEFDDPQFFAAAPTYSQAKRIYWSDLKAMIPRQFITGISESELTIKVVTGSKITVLGMDKPERIEGSPWDGGILDEYGNMKGRAWGDHVRPALADRNGWCDLIGVPEGRNHYYDRAMKAQAEMKELGPDSEWGYFHWKSSGILSAKEIEAAKRDLEPLVFDQEYNASFVNFVGRIYYAFDAVLNCDNVRKLYNPKAPLILCFDFNVDPGVCAIVQEFETDGSKLTAVIGEVHIPNNSTTPAVCRKIIQDWGTHEGRIMLYGDASGGARGTAKTDGSDWDIIERMLGDHFGRARVYNKVPKANPAERARVNAVNTRCVNGLGERRLMVDASACPNLVRDLEGVRALEGGSGEIDKKHDPKLTHISDALGYYIEAEHPIGMHRQVELVRVFGY